MKLSVNNDNICYKFLSFHNLKNFTSHLFTLELEVRYKLLCDTYPLWDSNFLTNVLLSLVHFCKLVSVEILLGHVPGQVPRCKNSHQSRVHIQACDIQKISIWYMGVYTYTRSNVNIDIPHVFTSARGVLYKFHRTLVYIQAYDSKQVSIQPLSIYTRGRM